MPTRQSENGSQHADSLLQRESLVDISTARRSLVPRKRNGKPPAPSTIWRWIHSGLHGVRLEVVYIGGTPYTSAEALYRFFAAVTVARTARRRSSAHRDATVSDADLREVGLLS